MSYRDRQRRRAEALLASLFGDPGGGDFLGKPRPFVLRRPELNLWEGIRKSSLGYFERNGISWWNGSLTSPSGHLLSSQVACVNHLFFLRDKEELATAVLKSLDPGVVRAVVLDEGFVEFEFIGSRQYLPERGWTRGANCTSVDAAMIGERDNGERTLFMIEWKYTEDYQPEDRYMPERGAVYDDLITAAESPFKTTTIRAFYFEPFYQMMRQTLLGWRMAAEADHGVTGYRHVHVIPTENVELRTRITSPHLRGQTITEALREVLKDPSHYLCISPDRLLEPFANTVGTEAYLSYLQQRYW